MKTNFFLWLERVKSSQTLMLGGQAIQAGLATGAGVWIFKSLIGLVQGFAFGSMLGQVFRLSGDRIRTLMAASLNTRSLLVPCPAFGGDPAFRDDK